MKKVYRSALLPTERHPVIAWAFRNGMNLKSLRSELGISNVTLHYWDVGTNKPSWTTLQRIKTLTNDAVTAEDCFAYWREKNGDTHD